MAMARISTGMPTMATYSLCMAPSTRSATSLQIQNSRSEGTDHLASLAYHLQAREDGDGMLAALKTVIASSG